MDFNTLSDDQLLKMAKSKGINVDYHTMSDDELIAVSQKKGINIPTTAGRNQNIVNEAVKGVKSAVTAPFTGRALETPEARGVGQGAIQGATMGYGMPILRAAIPGSEQVPLPTQKEELIGNLLSMPVAGDEIGLAGKAVGKLTPLVPAAYGYGYNPSNTKITPVSDPRRFVNAGVGVIGQEIGNIAQKIINPSAIQDLRKALKFNKWSKLNDEDIASGLSAIKNTQKEVNNLEDFINASKEAKTQVWGEIEGILNNAQAKTEYVNTVADISKAIPKKNFIGGNEIVKKLNEAIPKNAAKLTPEVEDSIKSVMSNYKNKRITINEAEDRLQRVNADLTSYFRASYRQGYVKGMQEDIGAKILERQILKNALYDKVESLTGSNIAPLKKQYGALMEIQDTALGRINVASRQNPISLQEAINGVLGIGDIFAKHPSVGLVKLIGSQIVKRFNNPDYLASRAVANLGKASIKLNRTIPVTGVMGAGSLESNHYQMGQILDTPKGQVKVVGFDPSDNHPLIEKIWEGAAQPLIQ